MKFNSGVAGAGAGDRGFLHHRTHAQSAALRRRSQLRTCHRRRSRADACRAATFGRLFGVFDGRERRHVDTDRVVYVGVGDRDVAFRLAAAAEVPAADAQLLQPPRVCSMSEKLEKTRKTLETLTM